MRSLKSLVFKVFLPMLTMASRTEWAWKMGLKASQDLHESLSNSAIPPVKRQDRLTAGKLEKYLAPRLQVQQNQFCWWFQPSLIFPSSVCHCNPNLQKKSRASCQKKPGYLVYIGDEQLPRYVMWGLFHKPWHKDPYQTTRIQWKVSGRCFFVAQLNIGWASKGNESQTFQTNLQFSRLNLL